jgi:hypothetical protein
LFNKCLNNYNAAASFIGTREGKMETPKEIPEQMIIYKLSEFLATYLLALLACISETVIGGTLVLLETYQNQNRSVSEGG